MPGQWERSVYGAHNVFISVGKGFGLVGLIAYLIYFAGPTVRVSRIIGLRRALPFVMFLLGIFLIFNSLDFANYKTFHVFNGIMIGLILGQKSASWRKIPHRQYRKNWRQMRDIYARPYVQGKNV
jgi:O-antigen ligase